MYITKIMAEDPGWDPIFMYIKGNLMDTGYSCPPGPIPCTGVDQRYL